jgi:methylthioribose-1-phosphate isomerase
MTASHADKPVYVVTPLLKVDRNTAYNDVTIEVREDKELWEEAPVGLENV